MTRTSRSTLSRRFRPSKNGAPWSIRFKRIGTDGLSGRQGTLSVRVSIGDGDFVAQQPPDQAARHTPRASRSLPRRPPRSPWTTPMVAPRAKTISRYTKLMNSYFRSIRLSYMVVFTMISTAQSNLDARFDCANGAVILKAFVSPRSADDHQNHWFRSWALHRALNRRQRKQTAVAIDDCNGYSMVVVDVDNIHRTAWYICSRYKRGFGPGKGGAVVARG